MSRQRHRSPGAARGVGGLDLPHDPVDLLRVRLEERTGHGALALAVVAGGERLDPRVHRAQVRATCGWRPRGWTGPDRRFWDSVKRGRGGVAAGREVLGEVLDVVDAGSSPAVDGLAGIADRHDAGGPSPKTRCSRTRCAIEVSWYSSSSTTRVARTQVGDDVGVRVDDLAGQPDLVGEVEHVRARPSPHATRSTRSARSGALGGGGEHRRCRSAAAARRTASIARPCRRRTRAARPATTPSSVSSSSRLSRSLVTSERRPADRRRAAATTGTPRGRRAAGGRRR